MFGFPTGIFRRQDKAVETTPEAPKITAADVEAAIDAAGREKVFATARALGWSALNPAPMWVWMQIAREVSASAPKAHQPKQAQTIH